MVRSKSDSKGSLFRIFGVGIILCSFGIVLLADDWFYDDWLGFALILIGAAIIVVSLLLFFAKH